MTTMLLATPGPSAEEMRALADALVLRGGGPYTEAAVQGFADGGWTAHLVRQIEVLAQWAAEHSPAFANDATRVLAARSWLTSIRENLCHAHPDMPEADILAWLTVLSGAPAGPERTDLVVLVTVDTAPTVFTFERWRALGTWGPLAYAAGLSLAEAEERVTAGTLTADGLRLLAGLRGYVLPAGEWS